MIKSLPILLLLIFPSTYSHPSDTLYNQSDSLKVDTTLVIEEYDSLSVIDSTQVLKEIVAADTLVPIQEYPLANQSQTINKRVFYFYNYWYTGDFLRTFSLNFIKDLAFLGQPNESFIYGAGFGGISFMEDGILWNDRYTNSLDLNQVQSEDVDSIEIVPSPRGFLYGPYNNPVTVNFIMKDFVSAQPYSRIRYYEGPYGEAMIDGLFSAQLYKRWKLSFGITNRSADDRYINSEFSSWQVNTKLKYYLSNSINLTALYSFVDSDVGLNGGVDVDSISNVTDDINSVLYDNIIAPVVYPTRVQSILNHNLGLRLQALPFNDAHLGLTLYYKNYKDEIVNNEETIVKKDENKTDTYGATLKFDQNVGIIALQLLSTFEHNKTVNIVETISNDELKIDQDYFSVSALLSLHLLDKKLIPAVYYKYYSHRINHNTTEYSDNNSGAGADLTYKINDKFYLFTGYSLYNQFNSDDAVNFEVGGYFRSSNVLIDIKFFTRNKFFEFNLNNPYWVSNGIETPAKNIKGLGVNFNYQIWKLLLETNASHYFDMKGYDSFMLPDFQFTGGVFVNDMFFDNNLYLKAGFIYYYTGNLKALATNVSIVDVEPSHKLDISVAGEIKEVAIVYFAWENLFNNQYFITPYYPMSEINIRFGISWELFD